MSSKAAGAVRNSDGHRSRTASSAPGELIAQGMDRVVCLVGGASGWQPVDDWETAVTTAATVNELPVDAIPQLRSDGAISVPVVTSLQLESWLASQSESTCAAVGVIGAVEGSGPGSLLAVLEALFDYGYVVCRPAEAQVDKPLPCLWAVHASMIGDPNSLGVGTRGVVGMSSLGTNGRLGNQLFQYAFLRLYALRHGQQCAVPAWDGQGFFGLQDSALPGYPLREVRFYAFDSDDLALWTYPERPTYADFWGYFQELPPCWARQRDLLRRLFQPVPAIQTVIEAQLAQLTDSGRRPLVALHIRRGDYETLAGEAGLGWYEPIPLKAYTDWLDAVLPTLVDPVLYIATDDPEQVLPAFAAYGPAVLSAGTDDLITAEYLDFCILRAASVMTVANSSYSRMAAILADDDQRAAIYSRLEGRFIDYAPWEDRAFWARFQVDGQKTSRAAGDELDAVRLRGLMARIQRGDALVELQQLKNDADAATRNLVKSVAELTAGQVSAAGSQLEGGLHQLQAELELIKSELSAPPAIDLPDLSRFLELSEQTSSTVAEAVRRIDLIEANLAQSIGSVRDQILDLGNKSQVDEALQANNLELLRTAIFGAVDDISELVHVQAGVEALRKSLISVSASLENARVVEAAAATEVSQSLSDIAAGLFSLEVRQTSGEDALTDALSKLSEATTALETRQSLVEGAVESAVSQLRTAIADLDLRLGDLARDSVTRVASLEAALDDLAKERTADRVSLIERLDARDATLDQHLAALQSEQRRVEVTLADTVHGSTNQLRDTLNQLDTRLDDLTATATGALTNLAGSQLELSGSLKKQHDALTGQIEQQRSELIDQIETQRVNLAQNIESQHAALAGKLATLHADLSGQLEAREAELASKLQSRDAAVDASLSALQSGQSGLADSFEEFVRHTGAQLREAKTELQRQLDGLTQEAASALGRLEAAQHSLVQELSARDESLSLRIDDTGARIAARFDEQLAYLQDRQAAVAVAFQEQITGLSLRLEDRLNTLAAKQADLDRKLEQAAAERRHDTQAQQSFMNAMAQEIRTVRDEAVEQSYRVERLVASSAEEIRAEARRGRDGVEHTTARVEALNATMAALSERMGQMHHAAEMRTFGGLRQRLRYRVDLTLIGTAVALFGWTSASWKARMEHLQGFIRARDYQGYRAARAQHAAIGSTDKAPAPSIPEGIPIDADCQIITPDGRVVEAPVKSRPATWFRSREQAPPIVSVIIPCYNYGAYLRECVESVLSQTLASVETIIVDNGSTDPLTIEEVALWKADPRVRVLQLKPNRGLPGARNAGIEIARGRYVCCIDADDMFAPTYLEKAVALLQTDPSLGFVYPWIRLFGADSLDWPTRDFDPFDARQDNYTAVCGVYRRTDWERCGKFNPDMHGGYDDWEFWIRLAAIGRRGRAIREPLFLHRKHDSNMTGSAHATREGWIQKMRDLSPAFFSDDDASERLRRLVPAYRPDRPFAGLAASKQPSQSDKPHLLVVAPWLPVGGGAEALLIEQVRHLAQRWRISIVTTVASINDMTPVFAALTPEIYHLPDFLDESDWLAFCSYLMADRGTRVVMSSGSQFHYANAAELRKRFPEVAFADLLHNDLPEGHIAAAVANSQAFDLHFAISGRIQRSLLAAGVPPERIRVIENGVDTDTLFRPNAVPRAVARRNLGLPFDGFTLAFVGRLSEEKRPLLFLDIVEQLSDVRGINAVLVGSGPLEAAVQARLTADFPVPVLRFGHRARESLPEVYAAADALVMTSYIEGQPFVLLEALSTGCPGACTAVGDIPRIVTDGINGFLADRDDPLQLVAKLRAFAADRELQASARTSAVEAIHKARMTRSAMVASYEEALCDLAKLPGPLPVLSEAGAEPLTSAEGAPGLDKTPKSGQS